jgi:hypothetical protein
MNKLLMIYIKYQRQIWSIILLLNLQITSAQIVTIDWIAEIGGSSFVNANSLYVDNSGNAYVTGFFMGEVTIGNNTFVASGDSDIFIAKYSQNGDVKWFKQAGSNHTSPNIASESGKAVAVDKAGNVYVCGIFVSRALFCDTVVAAHGSQDIFLAKYTNNGKLLWVKSMGHHGSNIAQELMVVGDVVYMTGKSSGSFLNEHHKNPLAFLAAFDLDGNLIWFDEKESSLMVLNTFLSSGNDHIYWGASTIEVSNETGIPDEPMEAFAFINKLEYTGNVKSSGTFRINQSSTDYKVLIMNNTVLLVESRTGIVRDVTAAVNEQSRLHAISSFNEIEEFETVANHKNDHVRSSVLLSKPGSLLKEISLMQWSALNYIAVNQDYSFDLFVGGEVHPFIQYAPGLRVFSTWLSDYHGLYILANYNGHLFFDEMNSLLSLKQNAVLLKMNLSTGVSVYDHDLEDDKDQGLFSVFPNPSSLGMFYIACSEPDLRIRKIIVKNTREQVIHSYAGGDLPMMIDLSNKPSGVYFIIIEHEEGTSTKKVVINK